MWRKITQDSLYFSEPFNRMLAWIDLLLIANHSEGMIIKRGIAVTIEPGQVGYDLDTLASRWKWSRGKVERYLLLLEKTKKIVRQKDNVTTCITICNWSEYQIDGKANKKANDKTNAKANESQTDANNNDKEQNNDKEYTVEQLEKFNKFIEWIDNNAERVNKMKKPFTIKQYFLIIQKYSPQQLANILNQMDNYNPLFSKYVSAYQTALNWLKNEEKRNNPVKNKPPQNDYKLSA